MRIVERLKAAYKAWAGSGNWVDSSLPGNVSSSGVGAGRMYWYPGSGIRWDQLTGELWRIPAVQACLNWIFRNFPQAIPVVEKKNAQGEWEALASHELLDLFDRPNPQYDGSVLFTGILLSLQVNGNAYCILERKGNGRIGEMWYTPHHLISPYTHPTGDSRIIDYFWYTPPGRAPQMVPPEDVWHLRWGCDPGDVRLGLSPLASGARDANSLQQAGNYRPNILRNFGTIGKLIRPKDNTGPTFDPLALKRHIDDQSQGDMAGGTVVADFAFDVDYPKVSPKDMDLDAMEDRPEANLAALTGVPLQCVGLHSSRHSNKYANVKEAREAGWEECLMPMAALIARQGTFRLLPEYTGSRNGKPGQTLRLNYDYSQVRPLQPDRDKERDGIRKDWLANLITLAEWKVATKRQPEPGDEKLRYRDMVGTAAAPEELTDKEKETEKEDAKGGRYDLRDLWPQDDWAEHVAEEIKLLGAASGNGNGAH